MYIQSLKINNIRSIDNFKMEFKHPAGWHVLIGDNGTGKSTIVRSIALALIGPEEIISVRPHWEDWLSMDKHTGKIELSLTFDDKYDKTTPSAKSPDSIKNILTLIKNKKERIELGSNILTTDEEGNPRNFNWGNPEGWFSVAYGPFRRFSGGNPEWGKVYGSYPKAGAHLSVFGEDVALTEALEWLQELDYKRLKEKEQVNKGSNSEKLFSGIKQFINDSQLLPHGAIFEKIGEDGPVFKDGNGNLISVTQLSDGYRSILSLTFELTRQLVRTYGVDAVFKDIFAGKMEINLPGVVLIDEIDAHLHPSWQTHIGNWFTQYFPAIQFIVTTHSPLICRASEKGTIWRLAAPGSETLSGEITGENRDRLINGNILDAYGTEVFGEDVSISESSNKKLNLLAELNMKSLMGNITDSEEEERQKLKVIFPTENTLIKHD
jgi:predicted ATP-binding protein involved in virulence